MTVITPLPSALFIIGAAFIFLESVLPGTYSIVIGTGLFGAGLLGLISPTLAHPLSLGTFAVLLSAVTLLAYQKQRT